MLLPFYEISATDRASRIDLLRELGVKLGKLSKQQISSESL